MATPLDYNTYLAYRNDPTRRHYLTEEANLPEGGYDPMEVGGGWGLNYTFDEDRFNREATLDGWEGFRLNPYADQVQHSGELARALGMTPQQYRSLYFQLNGSDVWGGGSLANPYVADRALWDHLVASNNLGGNAELTAMRDQLAPMWESGGSGWVSRVTDEDMSGWAGIMQVLQGAGFVAGALGGFSTLGALTGANVATAGAGALGIEGGGFGAGANSLWGSAAAELGLGGSTPPPGYMSDLDLGGYGDMVAPKAGGMDAAKAFFNGTEVVDVTAGSDHALGLLDQYGADALMQTGAGQFAVANSATGLNSFLGHETLSGFDQVGDYSPAQYEDMMRQVNGGGVESSWLDSLNKAYEVYQGLVDPFVQMATGGGVGDAGGVGSEGFRTETLAAEDAVFGAKRFGRNPALMPAGAFDTFQIGNPSLFIPGLLIP
jgi:hypothetical protein